MNLLIHMSILRISGGKKLVGDIRVSGSKNAATPLLAATLLTSEPCTLRGIPRIRDVMSMVDILKKIGAQIVWKDDHTLVVCTKSVQIKRLTLPEVRHAITSMRSSILLVAPLLVRFGSVTLPEPGGCIIGKRPLDTHFYALSQLGARITQHRKSGYSITAKALRGATVILPELSVTATENVLMASLGARGKTVVQLAAVEPHVVQLERVLQQMGAKIQGIGTHTVMVEGLKKLHGFDVTVIPDEIEAMTLAIAGVLTQGNLTIHPVIPENILLPLLTLQQLGAGVEMKGSTLHVRPPHRLRAFSIKALPAPGFSTDLQSPFGVLATQCSGTSLVHDPLYEGRLGYVSELVKMGANAIICDPHRVLITGPTPLVGGDIQSLDLRSGATLLLAGLVARGETLIHHAELLDRGYEQIDQRLNSLGASIQREG